MKSGCGVVLFALLVLFRSEYATATASDATLSQLGQCQAIVQNQEKPFSDGLTATPQQIQDWRRSHTANTPMLEVTPNRRSDPAVFSTWGTNRGRNRATDSVSYQVISRNRNSPCGLPLYLLRIRRQPYAAEPTIYKLDVPTPDWKEVLKVAKRRNPSNGRTSTAVVRISVEEVNLRIRCDDSTNPSTATWMDRGRVSQHVDDRDVTPDLQATIQAEPNSSAIASQLHAQMSTQVQRLADHDWRMREYRPQAIEGGYYKLEGDTGHLAPQGSSLERFRANWVERVREFLQACGPYLSDQQRAQVTRNLGPDAQQGPTLVPSPNVAPQGPPSRR